MPSKYWTGRPESELFEIGKYYGYPDCCVKNFCENCGRPGWNNYARNSEFMGTGFIPCPECAKRPPGDVLAEITKNRAQTTDFPNCDYKLCKKDLGLMDHA